MILSQLLQVICSNEKLSIWHNSICVLNDVTIKNDIEKIEKYKEKNISGVRSIDNTIMIIVGSTMKRK